MMGDPYLTKLFSEIRGDPGELEMVGVIHRRVTVEYKDGARIRRAPGIANNIVRTAEYKDTFETDEVESPDQYGNRWIQIPEGYICTFYNGTLRAKVEIIPSP
jgi:hypothetical protein